jgi:ATP-dependent exoDNAse (exonuclease V) alpha subunit
LAIYHLSIKIISRGKGKSAVAAAAYRSGEKIVNAYDGITHDYTRKSGVVHTEMLLPDHVPAEYADRAVLWNAVEKSERYKTAQLAREIELALPVELTREQNISLVCKYVNQHFVSAGMCADIAIHDKEDGNPHAHIMLTMRPIEKDGKWGQKSRTENGIKIPTVDWNEQTRAEDWRQGWADICNHFLEKNNHTERINHRSYERQGIDQIPTIHLGVAASQMEKKGIRTERGDINREIEVSNQKLRQLKARIAKLQNWLKEEQENTAPPTLADIITSVLSRREQTGQRSRYGTIHNLKAAAEIVNFLTANKITDMAGLAEKLSTMTDKQFDIRDELKKVERRIKTLDEHISHSGNFKGYRKEKAQYEKLDSEYRAIKKAGGFGAERKAKKALEAANHYYETHRMEITLYEAAERYLRGVLGERFDPKKSPPITKWQAELKQKKADLHRLDREYGELRTEVAAVEKIKRSVNDILREEVRTPQRNRGRDMEL